MFSPQEGLAVWGVGLRGAMRPCGQNRGLEGMVRPEGLEPPAFRFEACRSIQLSYGRVPASFILAQTARLSRLSGEAGRQRCRPPVIAPYSQLQAFFSASQNAQQSWLRPFACSSIGRFELAPLGVTGLSFENHDDLTVPL